MPISPGGPIGARLGASATAAAALVAIAALAAASGRALGLGPLYAIKATAIFGVGVAVIVVLARRHLVSGSFGAANRVTLARGGLTALVYATLGEAVSPNLAWFIVGVASLALVMDGIDGWLARSRGSMSAFGARFDMETDALLIFGAALLVWQHDKAGAWILAAGLMRYAFLAAGYVASWMKRTLPASRRRQTICVVQVVSLIACLAPVVDPQLSRLVAVAGLTLLSWSFAVDVVWLHRRREAD